MGHAETIDKQQQMQRVLDRVQQLPILPGITIDPKLLRGIDAGEHSGTHLQPYAGNQKSPAATVITAGAPRRAVGPIALALTTAMSTIIVAMVATVITLDMARKEPPPRVAGTNANRAHVDDMAGLVPQIESSSGGPHERYHAVVGNRLFQDVQPAAVAPESDTVDARLLPEPRLPANTIQPGQYHHALGGQSQELAITRTERENNKRRASMAAIVRKGIARAPEQSERTNTVEQAARGPASGVGDVLSGGL